MNMKKYNRKAMRLRKKVILYSGNSNNSSQFERSKCQAQPSNVAVKQKHKFILRIFLPFVRQMF